MLQFGYTIVLMFHFHIFLSATDLLLAWNPVCLGLVEGVIGKIQLHTGEYYSHRNTFEHFLRLSRLFAQNR